MSTSDITLKRGNDSGRNVLETIKRILSSYAIPFFYCVFLFSIPFKNAFFQISLVLINLSFLVLLVIKIDLRTFFMPYRSLWLAMGLIALSMGISNFFGVSGNLGWEEMIKHISRFYPFLFATLYFFHHRKITLPFIAYALFIVFFFHALYGLCQFFWDVALWGPSLDKFGERLSGVTYNPNQYGFIMALAVVFSFALGIQIKKLAPKINYRFCRLMLTLLWLASFWCLLQSGSRAAWLAAAFGMMMVAFITPHYLKQKHPWVFIFLLCGFLFFLFEVNHVFQGRMQALLAGDSANRLDVWQDCLHYIVKKPLFGYGLEAYQMLDRVYPEIHSPHNVFVAVLLEMGVLGLFAYLYFFFICIRRLILPEYRQPVTIVFAGFLVVFLIAGLFSHSFITDKIYLSCLYFTLALIFVGKAGEGLAQYQLLVKEPPSPHSVLLIEPNDHHGEVVLGYAEYFVRLGFFVNVVVTPRQMQNKPFASNNLPNISFYAIDEIFLRSLLVSDHVRQYSIIFFTSAKTLHGPICYYTNAEIAPKVFAVLHHKHHLSHKKMKKLYQDKRLVVLRNFSNDPQLFEVNPHSFGDVMPGPRNKKTHFICVGSFSPALRNTALFIETVEAIVRSGINDFFITIITRKKMEKQLPKTISSFFDVKIGLDYESMYHEMERADFFLPLLDPDIPSQREYLSEFSTGSIQLILGFLCPAVMDKLFAGAYEMDGSNTILYERRNLREAMLEAMQIPNDRYRIMQRSLLDLSERKKKSSLANLEEMLRWHGITIPVSE